MVEKAALDAPDATTLGWPGIRFKVQKTQRRLERRTEDRKKKTLERQMEGSYQCSKQSVAIRTKPIRCEASVSLSRSPCPPLSVQHKGVHSQAATTVHFDSAVCSFPFNVLFFSFLWPVYSVLSMIHLNIPSQSSQGL